MIKFFLNAFNNKNNFYKFISFKTDENDKDDKNIIHKNYFGKNPFRDSNDIINNKNSRNKLYFKTINKVNNFIQDRFSTFIPQTQRISSPNMKNCDSYISSILLNNKNKANISSLDHKNKIKFKNKSKNKIMMKNSKLNTGKSYNINTSRESYKYKTLYKNFQNEDLKNKNNTIQKFNNRNKDLKNNDINNSYELKIEEYQTKPKNKIIIPPIITNQINKEIHLNNKNRNLYSSLFSENIEDKNIKSTRKNDVPLRWSNLIEKAFSKIKIKSISKSMNKNKKYLDDIEDYIILKNENLTKNEDIQLNQYFNDFPDFLTKDNCKKNIFFGMNKKALFQNNFLFTEYK